MWSIDNNGNYKEISGEHSIRLNPEVNSIKFTAKYEGFIYAYVVGDFNNWEKRKEYRISCKIDPDDGVLKFSKDIIFKNGLATGDYNYSYVLIDVDGNEFFLKPKNNKPQASFHWKGKINLIEIKSSSNQLYIDEEISLIATKTKRAGKIEIVNLNWSLKNDYDGAVLLTENKITLLKEIPQVDEIEIIAFDLENNKKIKKKIKIINAKRNGVLVHFIKSDNIYLGENFKWDIWGFDNNKEHCSIEFTEKTDFGLCTFVEHENIIIRKKTWGDGWFNDWSEQTPSYKLDKNSKNIYIVYGDFALYNNLNNVINSIKPRIETALMDNKNKITAYLSHEPVGTQFNIYVNGILKKDVNSLIKAEKRKVVFTNLPLDILSSDLIEVRATNTFIPCKVTMRNFLDKFFYPNADMGATFTKDKIHFRVWSPTAKNVELLIYDNWTLENYEPSMVHPMKNDYSTGTYYNKIDRLLNENKFYLYRLYFDDINRAGEKYTKITYAIDPYAVSSSVNGDKAALVNIFNLNTMPKDWFSHRKPPLNHKKDSIIYEMHIRDFTINKNSGLPESLRGKYLGAAEKGTTYMSPEGKEVSTALDHLVELGVTHVHLLPIFDFATVDERFPQIEINRNWGYDPKNYNVPEGSYSTNPKDPISRVLELRTMIKSFHDANIRVVMDMVYNHMYDTKNLDSLVPGYYFRSNKCGRFTNGSGCGNELATERPMVSKFIIDSITHWLLNYKIDGLRFDLMELMDFDTMKKIIDRAREVDKNILIYGEPWKAGDSPLENGVYKGSQQNQGFSIFNDSFRDAIRGNNDPSTGFVSGNQHHSNTAWTIIEGLKGSVNSLTANPFESINYVDAHDNYTLWDQIEKTENMELKNGDYRKNLSTPLLQDKLVKRNLLALSIILTAQGIPFLHGGCEILRTKNGDHNSYKSSDLINAFNWEDKANFKEFFDYIKTLINIRKEHPAFRVLEKDAIIEHININFLNNDEKSGVIISRINAEALGDEFNNIVIIYNGTNIDNYNINSGLGNSETGYWNIIANDFKADTKILTSYGNGDIPPISAHSILIAYN
ncbi:MAG: type I pullulanase [Sarcina sp.]